MIRPKWLIALAVLCALAIASGLPAADKTAKDASGGVTLSIVPEHEDGIYAAGETVRFLITGKRGDKPLAGEVAYELQLNAAKKLKAAKITLKDGRAAITWQLKEPGCLIATVTIPDGNKPITAKVGAVVDPFKIQQSLAIPDDFDAFWAGQKRKLAEIPMNAKLTPVESQKVNYGPEIECFDVQLDCLGDKPASGYFGRPKGAKPKSLPALLSVHSAGIRGGSIRGASYGARRNMLTFNLNAHGLPNGKPAEFYAALRDGELLGYANKGMDSPETFYFKGMYLRIVRAIDFLTSQPEWDGKTVIVRGSSQGGGQALVAAGIDPRVTELSAGVPAFCDTTAALLDRKPGWPGTRTKKPGQIKTLQYFDACNFASRSRAKATVIVGLIDTTCPPVGILAAYNQLKGEKSITILPFRGHGLKTEQRRLAKDPKFKHSHKLKSP
jgi:cephalosporin-C deacetylase